MSGFVYILECDAMPGLVKVGMTERHPRERADELTSATGIPSPFKVIRAYPVVDPKRGEAVCHEVLRGFRYSENREFFRTSLMHATAMVEVVLEQEGLLDDPLCVDRAHTRENLEKSEKELAELQQLLNTDEHLKSARILQLEARIGELETEVAMLRSELPKPGYVERLEAAVNELGQKQKNVETEKDLLRKTIREQAEKIKSSEGFAAHLRIMQARIASLEETLKERDASIKMLKSQSISK